MNDLERDIVLLELSRLSGKTLPAKFFRQKRTNPAVKGEYEYHNLVRGIYKPTGCEMATSILQTLKGPYEDALLYDNGTWHLDYLQQGRGKMGWDNLSLERCIPGAPVAVIVQQSTKDSKTRSGYKVLGLGRVESYDKQRGIFKVEKWQGDFRSGRVKATERDVSAQEEEMNSLLLKPFEPFEDSRPSTFVKRKARGEAFRRQVIALYEGRCGVCGIRWKVDGQYETQAAHIIPKSDHGTDDPRNGIAFCRFHHWAFDRGLFSITDQGTVIVSPRIAEFSDRPDVLKAFAGSVILPPADVHAKPSLEALIWHRTKTFMA
jgi:hypothetical protein